MARFWSGTIDSIALVDGGSVAGFDLHGAEAFAYDTTGNSIPSLNGTVQTQYEPITEGRILELRFIHIPQSLLTSLLASLNVVLLTGGSVTCSFTDGFQTITGSFKPNVPAWYERGNPDGAYVNDAVLRLVSVGA